MKARRTLQAALLGGIVAAIVVLLAGIWLGGHQRDLPSPLRGGFFEGRRAEPATEQAVNILTRQYYRPLQRSRLVNKGLAGMVASLDDPYTHYLSPSAYRERNQQRRREFVGIGIRTTAEPQGLRVVDVFERSPAAGAGLKPGDLITEVGSTSLADRSEEFGSDLIRGPAGTAVKLTLRRGDTRQMVSVTRAKIVAPVTSRQMLTYDDVRIGHLTLTRFADGAGDELRAQIQAALHAHAQALILDLRSNGGGLISEAVNVASAFIPSGKILSAQERGRSARVYMAEGDAIAPRIPLVVLVDHGTASASEIVTAALQDHGRAKVVGERTYGKGTFQITERLRNGGALDFTIGRYFTPDGRNLGSGGGQEGAGISPDVDARDDPDTQADEALEVAERTVAAEVR